MTINLFEKEAKELAIQLQAIEYNKLPISNYNKQYLERLEKAYLYYTRICGFCLATNFTTIMHRDHSFTLVDYGGGCGILSMMAKKIGIERVIYIDLNPQSAETVKVLKEQTGLGPDIILQGDSDTLTAWCAEQDIKPDLLIGLDVIEHIYNLNIFFSDLSGISKEMEMMFTTASNPLNLHVRNKLHKQMLAYEKGGNASPNYYAQRKDFITRTYPEYPSKEVEKLSLLTRGFTFEDMNKLIKNIPYMNNSRLRELPAYQDSYNTCDPRNGNWMERILPLKEYKKFKPLGYECNIRNGFYHADRKKGWASFVAKMANYFILRTKRCGLLAAPFMIIHYYHSPKGTE